jgi:stage III sporulation protein AD
MELMLKAAAASLLSAAIALLIRRHNPETALMLAAITALCILAASLGVVNGFQALRDQVRRMLGEKSELLLTPLVKCLAISVVAKFAAEMCRDSGQNAVCAAVEMAGTACALSTVMPLLLSVLKMIGELV